MSSVADAPAVCPKCGAPRAPSACPRCGLRAERMDAFARERDADVHPDVRAAWDKVVAAWDDAALHDAVFTLTAQHRAYTWTAARYREARAGKPEGTTDPHLERVRKAAEATLLASATATVRGHPSQPYKSSFIALVLVGFMIVLGLVLAMYMRAKGPSPDRSSISPGTPASTPGQVR